MKKRMLHTVFTLQGDLMTHNSLRRITHLPLHTSVNGVIATPALSVDLLRKRKQTVPDTVVGDSH